MSGRHRKISKGYGLAALIVLTGAIVAAGILGTARHVVSTRTPDVSGTQSNDPASTDGRFHRCGLVTEDGVTEHLDAYAARCGTTVRIETTASVSTGHWLNVNDQRVYVPNVKRELPRPTERQLARFDCLTMGNRKCGTGWHRLSPALQDSMYWSTWPRRSWGTCRVHFGDTMWIDCPDWSVWSS